MKIRSYMALFALATAPCIAMASPANMMETTKGERQMTWVERPDLITLDDSRSLRAGDRVEVYVPETGTRMVTTVRSVDSKGRILVRERGEQTDFRDSRIVFRREAGSKEVQPMIIRENGKLTPAVLRWAR